MPNRTHIVQPGDTLDLLSSRYYGEPSQSGRILSANPGTTGTLVPGSTLLIPTDATAQTATESEGLSIRINGEPFKYFEAVAITRRIDAVDTFTFRAPQADTPEFRRSFTPLSYADIDISDGRDRLLRGTMVDVVPKLSTDTSSVEVSGYSTPGVLGDCMLPESAWPLELRGLVLKEIANKLCQPFSISVKSETDTGAKFPRVKLKRDNRILQFISTLAKQRQLLVRSNPDGELVLAGPPRVSTPVARLKQDESPVISIEPQFAPAQYYSHVTGVRTTRRGRVGSKHTVQNPLATSEGVIRPLVHTISDTDKGELPKATDAALGRMIANCVTYTTKVVGWRDPAGQLWEPGATIELEAPRVFVYSPYKFQVRSVQFDDGPDQVKTATLLLMLPGAFDGTPPAMLPWG